MLPLHDPADIGCQSMDQAIHLAVTLAIVGTLVAGVAWRVRNRIAMDGHQFMWALSSLLCGALHIVAALMLIPIGCTSADNASQVVASALPWALAAGLFRTGVAPIPPELRPDYLRGEGARPSSGDPFP